MYKGIKFRIYPNNTQRKQIEKNFEACRFVYNHFLEIRKDAWNNEKRSVSTNKLSRMLTEMKREPEYLWLNEADGKALQQSLRNLDAAFSNFFQKNSEYPKFHSARGTQTYQTIDTHGCIRIEGNRLRLPKLGGVRFRGMQDFDGEIKTVTVIRTPSGKYFASMSVIMEDVVKPSENGKIGIDVGIKEFYTDSNGNSVANPHPLRNASKKVKREHQRLSRKQKGSKNYEKQRQRLCRQYEKVTNMRNNFIHEQTTAIAKKNEIVCVEDLKIQSLMKNHKMVGAISDVSWGTFFSQLEYKTREHGGVLVRVPTFYPSSQTCSCCGYKNTDVKNLKVRRWTCPQCGATHDRDVNAAINILDKGLDILAGCNENNENHAKIDQRDGKEI